MNFGPTYASRSRTVNDIFRDQLPVSFQLGMFALAHIAVSIGMPLGIMSALNHNKWPDYLGMGVAIFGVSVPTIVLAPTLVWIFGVSLKWLPPTGWGAKPPFVMGLFPSHLGWDYFKYAILPAFVLGFGSSAVIARLTRASVLQVIREDYIRTARAKGLSERLVDPAPCSQERADPGRDCTRSVICRAGDRYIYHGISFWYSGTRKVFCYQHQQPRLSGHYGHDFALCRFSGDIEFGSGSDLRLSRSAHPLRVIRSFHDYCDQYS